MSQSNKHISFERNRDPKDAMNTGAVFQRNYEQIKKVAKYLCEKYKGTQYADRTTESQIYIRFYVNKLKYIFIGYNDHIEIFENYGSSTVQEFEVVYSVEEAAQKMERWIKKRLRNNESVRFERNQEPKQAMDVGLYHEIKEFVKKHSTMFKWTEDLNALLIKTCVHFLKYSYVRFLLKQNNIPNESKAKGLRVAFYENHYMMVKFIMKHSNLTVREALSIDDVLEIRRFYKTSKAIDKLLAAAFPEITYQSTNESYNFDRKLDPKDAMKIGDVEGREEKLNIKRVKLSKKIYDNVVESVMPLIKDLNIQAENKDWRDIADYSNHILSIGEHHPREYVEKNQDSELEQGIDKMRDQIRSILKTYFNSIEYVEKAENDFIGHVIGDGPPKGTLLLNLMTYLKWDDPNGIRIDIKNKF